MSMKLEKESAEVAYERSYYRETRNAQEESVLPQFLPFAHKLLG